MRAVQLQDLRRMVARMLAVDTSGGAPDYEIVSRLEKLILASQASSAADAMATTPLLDAAVIRQLSDEFRAGYRGAGRTLADLPPPRSPAKPNPGRPPRPGPRRPDNKVY